MNIQQLARDLERVGVSAEADALIKIIRDAARLLSAELQRASVARRTGHQRASREGGVDGSAPAGRPSTQSSHEGNVENGLLVERVFELQRAIQGKNDVTAQALQRAIIPLLEYRKPLAAVKREALLALDGVGPKAVDLIQRVIGGEPIETIAASVPTIVRKPQGWPSSRTAPDRGNWDGSWDNSVKAVEGN